MQSKTTDRIIGISAILISLLTLIIFIFQTNVIRKQSRLSVTPRLSFSTSMNVENSLLIYTSELQNKGLGPGIIESAKIIIDDQEFALESEDFFKERFPKLFDLGEFRNLSSFGVGQTLSPGESETIFSYQFQNSLMKELSEYLGFTDEDNLPFEIEIIFSSIYEEKWKVSSVKEGHPIKLN